MRLFREFRYFSLVKFKWKEIRNSLTCCFCFQRAGREIFTWINCDSINETFVRWTWNSYHLSRWFDFDKNWIWKINISTEIWILSNFCRRNVARFMKFQMIQSLNSFQWMRNFLRIWRICSRDAIKYFEIVF